MRNKFNLTFIILIFFVETIFINPNIYSITSKDSQIIENPFKVLPPQDPNELLANAPQSFTENRGQLENDKIRFYVQSGGVWFSDEGMWIEIREELSFESRESRIQSQGSDERFEPMERFREPKHTQYKHVILKQEFVGTNQVKPIGKKQLSWYSNFLYGNDSSKWYTEVPNYQEVYYENLYNGIDLRYYTNERGLKYDFIVHPGANLSRIRVKYEGAEKLKIDDLGNLVVKTKLEDIVDGKLFIYQDYAGARHQVNGRFVIYDNLKYSFEILEDYREQEILVIDPLVFSTYIGGSLSEQSSGMAIDSVCNVYITGDTSSVDFPNTTSAYNTINNGDRDIFVFKLDPTGSSLIYSTYIGGTNYDGSSDIAIDLKGYIYLTGWTESFDFPNTTGAYDPSYNGGGLWGGDAFILKLGLTGSSLIYSTFIGGNDDDGGSSITIDFNDNAFISGGTKSFNFPNTTGVYDPSYNGGGLWGGDVFALKLDSTGSSLMYSTFVGGSKNDGGSSIAIDSNGNAFISGITESSNFPYTTNADDNTYNGGLDVFILKLNPTGSSLIYSTFVGGSNNDSTSWGISVDSSGNTYITGSTESSDFPITTGAYDTTYNGNRDIFVLKLNSRGSSLIYSTFIGGSNRENSGDIVIDSNNNAYITGNTFSPNFPNTTDAYDNNFNGVIDGIFFKLNPLGSSLIYSTFIGGNDSAWESITRLVIDHYCKIYITGITDSIDFPNTTGAYDNIYNGNQDVFVLKLDIMISNNFPIVLDFKISKSAVFRANKIYLYSNSSDIEDLERKLTLYFVEYRDPNYLFWNNSYFSKPQYNNSRWEVIFTPPKNTILGLYDFRIMFNDTDQLFSSWFYLNDSLTILNNIPSVENLYLSHNKALLGDKISIWINCSDIEEPEENLTIELKYRNNNEQSWDTSNLDNPKYINERWECNLSIPFETSFGYYNFKVRFNDSNGGYSQLVYANNSLLIYNKNPRVIDIQLSNNSIYRTNSVFLYIKGTDHETQNSMLKLYAQYKSDDRNDWINLVGKYNISNNLWEVEFNTTKESTLGLYDFRIKFEDNESISSGWQYLNNSLEVLNNIPIVVDLNVSEYNIFRTEPVILYVNGTDIENFEELLTCEIQYKSPSGTWIPLNGSIFKSDHWEINFTTFINTELGIYDLRVNFTDLNKGYSGWVVIENAIELKNNLPIISTLCDDFEVDFQPKDIDLTQYEFDIEDSNRDLIWDIDQTTVNTTLFSAIIVDVTENILRIIPQENTSGSDDITLILTDKDGGYITKSDVTIFVNSITSHYYNVNITIFPNYVKIVQGKSQNITLTITNIGNLSDNYTIIFQSGEFNIEDFIFEMNFMSINSGDSENVNVTISIPKDMNIDEYRITFIVKSDYAIDVTILTINVKDNKNKEDNVLVFANIWIIVILTISLIAVSGFYYYRKKYTKQKPSSAEKILIKSTAVSKLNKTLIDDSTSLNLEQQSGSTKEDNNAQQMQAVITPTPPLAKPIQIAQITAPQQIRQITSQPKLESTESQPKLAQKIIPPISQLSSSPSENSTVRKQDEQTQIICGTNKAEQ